MTMCYEATHLAFYRAVAEAPPPGVRPDIDLAELFAWHGALPQTERDDLDRRFGFSVTRMLGSCAERRHDCEGWLALPASLDQLHLVAVGVCDERDHRGAALHRPGLARDRAALGLHRRAGRRGVGHVDRDVAEAGAEVVLVDAVVVGELEHRALRFSSP